MRTTTTAAVLVFQLFALRAWCFSVGFARSATGPMTATQLRQSSEAVETTELLKVSLEKPLGMVLEEAEEGSSKGVYVLELADEGSAAASEYKDQLSGATLCTVMGDDCTALAFDDVMDKLINAPSPVELEFSVASDKVQNGEPDFEVGTQVQIKVLEDNGKETVIDTKVGENLRQVLLANNIEVYKGLKKKLGNCGGGGQCTFCAVDFVESEGWPERSEYEDGKLRKFPNARLSCLNNIQGPATIRL